MTTKIDQKLAELKELLCDELSDTTTYVEIFINSQGINVNTTQRTPEELKRDGVSMRNIKGEWIK